MQLTINDQRGAGDPSLQYYPRMTTWDQVQSVFKLQILTDYGWDATQSGELCWKLVGFNVRTGAAIFFPRVLGMDAKPYWHTPTNTGALVIHTWAGAPGFPIADPIRPDYNPVLEAKVGGGFRTHHALANWTKQESGDADFAYGGGMVTGENGGPGVAWVSAVPPEVPKTEGAHYSDCVARMGWIGGTDHLTASPVFQLTRKEGSPPIPPTPGEGLYLAAVDASGTILGRVEMKTGTVPSGVGSFVLYANGEAVAYVLWD